ncbi:XRE family transcriptional regulator [Acetobacter cerevisiae DSM 14362]|nr:XRE family transcriptional regulator [Acetobacter cerevisiae DSM 14362]
MFFLAQIIGQLEQSHLISQILRREGPRDHNAQELARVYLSNYFAGALILPYGRFLHQAKMMRYDIEKLRRFFSVSFEQVCHRLSTLQRPGSEGIAFYFLKLDIAGNILKSFSANRFSQARFGGPCPLWNVFRAFATPGQIQVQLSQTTDDAIYLNVARTVGHEGSSYSDRPRQIAMVLGCAIADAPQTVYAAGLNMEDHTLVVPIGPGCRACGRDQCSHRSLPVSGRILDTGNHARGVVPYRALPE